MCIYLFQTARSGDDRTVISSLGTLQNISRVRKCDVRNKQFYLNSNINSLFEFIHFGLRSSNKTSSYRSSQHKRAWDWVDPLLTLKWKIVFGSRKNGKCHELTQKTVFPKKSRNSACSDSRCFSSSGHKVFEWKCGFSHSRIFTALFPKFTLRSHIRDKNLCSFFQLTLVCANVSTSWFYMEHTQKKNWLWRSQETFVCDQISFSRFRFWDQISREKLTHV